MLKFNPFEGPEHQPFMLAGGDKAVLLVHGFPGSPAELRPLGERLHQAGWTVHGLLLPGFGPQINSLGQFTMRDWLAAVEHYLQDLERKHPEVVLVGFSMGGGLSLAVSARRPPAKLVLISPFWNTRGWFWAGMPLFKHILPSIKPFRALKIDRSDAEAQQGIASFLPPGADLEDPQVQKAIKDFEFPLKILDDLRQVGLAARKAAPLVQTPKLILQGAQDRTVSAASTRLLLRHLAAPLCYQEFTAGHDIINPQKSAWSELVAAILSYIQ